MTRTSRYIQTIDLILRMYYNIIIRFHISYRIFRSSAKVKFFNTRDYCWILKFPTSNNLQLVSHDASSSYLITCSPNKCEVLK